MLCNNDGAAKCQARDLWWSSAAIDLAHIFYLMANSLQGFNFFDYMQM